MLSRTFIVNENISSSLDLSLQIGARALVRSLTGLNSYISTAQNLYPNTQVFMPLGSNSDIEITNPSYISCIITTGAGDIDNDTAYGNGLEFWDDDLDGNVNIDSSSFANGVVAGKILYIKETLNCTWWEARYRARMTASNNGNWNKYSGYGKIDKYAAVNWIGVIPEDPYL